MLTGKRADKAALGMPVPVEDGSTAAACASAGVAAGALAVSASAVPTGTSGEPELPESEPSAVPKFEWFRDCRTREAKLWLLLPPPVSPILPPFRGDNCTLCIRFGSVSDAWIT